MEEEHHIIPYSVTVLFLEEPQLNAEQCEGIYLHQNCINFTKEFTLINFVSLFLFANLPCPPRFVSPDMLWNKYLVFIALENNLVMRKHPSIHFFI